MRKTRLLTGVLALSVCLTGCQGLSGLKTPYSFEERQLVFESGDLEDGYGNAFAEDLCVITDENQYADSAVDSEAAAVFDLTDAGVIYSKNGLERLYPASTTKIMTAIVAIENGNMTDQVTVTQDAVITEAGATLCGIKPGDQISMEQLLYGLMMPSGNDAANAIAVHVGGSVEGFVQMMNEKAQSLGATDTHFMNAHGLNDEQHYTTAYDLYLMFNYAMKLPLFREVVSTTSYTADFTDGSGQPVSKTWKIGNQYLNGERQTPEGLTVLGGKTGTTKAAGNCLVMGSADDQGNEYISVVLKAANRNNLYDNMTNIISKIVN